MGGPIPGRRPRIRPRSLTKEYGMLATHIHWPHFWGVNIDGCRKVMEMFLASEYDDFIQTITFPVVECVTLSIFTHTRTLIGA